MINNSIVIIFSKPLEEIYLGVIAELICSVHLVDEKDFIRDYKNFSVHNLLVIESSSNHLPKTLELAKKIGLTTLLLPKGSTVNFDSITEFGATFILPTQPTVSSIFAYIETLFKKKKAIITSDNELWTNTGLINAAVGILMVHSKLNKENSYNKLRQNARNRRKKIELVSREVILAQNCLIQYNCDFIESFNDEKNCTVCTDACPYHPDNKKRHIANMRKLASEEIVLTLQSHKNQDNLE